MPEYYNVMVAEDERLTEDEQAAGKTPKSYFTKVGVAWPQGEDAKLHMKIKLTALPLNGELLLFPPKESE